MFSRMLRIMGSMALQPSSAIALLHTYNQLRSQPQLSQAAITELMANIELQPKDDFFSYALLDLHDHAEQARLELPKYLVPEVWDKRANSQEQKISPAQYYLQQAASTVIAGFSFNVTQTLLARIFAKQMVQIVVDTAKKDGVAAIKDLLVKWQTNPRAAFKHAFAGVDKELLLTTPAFIGHIGAYQLAKQYIGSEPLQALTAALTKALLQTASSRVKAVMLASDQPKAALERLCQTIKADPSRELLRGFTPQAAREGSTFYLLSTFGQALEGTTNLPPIIRQTMAGLLTTLITHPLNNLMTKQKVAGTSFTQAVKSASKGGNLAAALFRGYAFMPPITFAILAGMTVGHTVKKALEPDADKVDWQQEDTDWSKHSDRLFNFGLQALAMHHQHDYHPNQITGMPHEFALAFSASNDTTTDDALALEQTI